MGKTDSQHNPDDQAGDNADMPGPAQQLTFFDTVMPPTMTTENSISAEADQREAHESSSVGADNTAVAEMQPLPHSDDAPAPEPAAHSDPIDVSAAQDGDIHAVATADVADTTGIPDAHVAQGEAGAVECRAEMSLDIPVQESLGQRLRAAREARGMRCEEVAQRMKLPLVTVRALEADCYDRIGEGIYLRSYLSKYLHLLDLPQVLAERVLNQPCDPPPLITSGTISRPRYLFERYSSSALYLILTAVIIVPAVWLAMRAGFEPGAAQITSLDAPAPASTSPSTDTPHALASADTATDATRKPADETPLVASLAPFPAAIKRSENESTDKSAVAVMHTGEHMLRLTLAEASWVEVTSADGEKLEYGLLPAGTTRTYHNAKTVDVRLGNSSGATVDVDGQAQDLTPFRHSNVAHFKLSGGETTLSHSGG